MLRAQNGSEHELTDVLVLSRTRFEVHVLCGEQRRPSAGVRNRHSGVVLFSRCCRCVFEGQCRQILSVVYCLFSLSARRFLCAWSETVNLKVNTSVDESDSTR